MKRYKRKFEEALQDDDLFAQCIATFNKVYKLKFKASDFKDKGSYSVCPIDKKEFGIFAPMFDEVDLSCEHGFNPNKSFYYCRVDYQYKHPSGSNGYQVGTVMVILEETDGFKKGATIFRNASGNIKEIK